MKINNMTKGEWGKVRAYFDVVSEDGFTLKGFKLIQANDMFVGFPSQKNKDGEYKNTIYADKVVQQKLNKLAIDYYNNNSNNQSGSSQSDDIPF